MIYHNAKPPNYDIIVAAFPKAKNKTTVFSYYPDIYTQSSEILPPELLAHEQVHIDRQGRYPGGPKVWWDRYLTDKEFRFQEELVAHVVEYAHILKNYNREYRRNQLPKVVARMAGPLYNFGMSHNEIEARIIALCE